MKQTITCAGCGRADVREKAGGLCSRCYTLNHRGICQLCKGPGAQYWVEHESCDLPILVCRACRQEIALGIRDCKPPHVPQPKPAPTVRPFLEDGGTYLITTDNWFYAPNGDQYRGVWGRCQLVRAEDLLGRKPERSADWGVLVEDELFVAGCQIHYVRKTDQRPDVSHILSLGAA